MTRDAAADTRTTGATAAAGQDPALMREMRLQRNLKVLVVGLGLLILLGLAAVAYRIVTLSAASRNAAGLAQGGTFSGPARDIALDLPKGARVVSVALSGSRAAVHYEAPSGTGIAILDTETGARIADIRPQEVVPTAR